MQGLHLFKSLQKGICNSLSESAWEVTSGSDYI